MNDWQNCRHVLVIRADNMGDVIMSTPAIKALKQTLNCKITLLTSAMGGMIQGMVSDIDDYIVFNAPWIKTPQTATAAMCFELIEILKSEQFDAAVIFTVYSQSALPAALICLMAGIPLRLAYCRENPYDLLTHWVPDEEPYSFIQHQVERDIKLVQHIGAKTADEHLALTVKETAMQSIQHKLNKVGVDAALPFIILHPGVSEEKRQYPIELWIEAGKALQQSYSNTLLITGAPGEKALADAIKAGIGDNSFVVAGLFIIEEFIALVKQSALVITVNTSTVHIAAAMQTPQVVLYALTNPQHTPWQSPAEVLYFAVKDELKSKSPIINYVSNQLNEKNEGYPSAEQIVQAAQRLLPK